MQAEADKLSVVIDAFHANAACNPVQNDVNGKRFFLSADFVMTGAMADQLEEFSRAADEYACAVYAEDDSLVIF